MFTVYGPGVTDPMRLERLLNKPSVRQPSQVQRVLESKLEVASRTHQTASSLPSAYQVYREQERTSQSSKPLHAAQVMVSPVIFLYDEDSLEQAYEVLAHHHIRHLPLLSKATGRLVGILSDRDMCRCQCASRDARHTQSTQLKDMMEPHVLAAHPDADVRDIARVFVEKHLGAMPIVEEHELVGMLTRSDILRVVMLHLNLDVWK